MVNAIKTICQKTGLIGLEIKRLNCSPANSGFPEIFAKPPTNDSNAYLRVQPPTTP